MSVVFFGGNDSHRAIDEFTKELLRVPCIDKKNSGAWLAKAKRSKTIAAGRDWVKDLLQTGNGRFELDKHTLDDAFVKRTNGEIARMFQRVTFVSNDEFERSLRRSAEWVNSKLQTTYMLAIERMKAPCKAGVCSYKSSEWIYKNIEPHLHRKPCGIVEKTGYNNDVLLCDDAVYSGSQSGSTIAQALNRHTGKHVNVYVVAPYVSPYAIDTYICYVFDRHSWETDVVTKPYTRADTATSFVVSGFYKHNLELGVTLHVSKINIMPSCSELAIEERVSPSTVTLMCGRVNTAFEFKIADYLSFPKIFADLIASATGQCAGTKQENGECAPTEPYKNIEVTDWAEPSYNV